MLTKEEEELGINWVRSLGIEGLRKLVLDELCERFGLLPEKLQQQVAALSSVSELASLGRQLMGTRAVRQLQPACLPAINIPKELDLQEIRRMLVKEEEGMVVVTESLRGALTRFTLELIADRLSPPNMGRAEHSPEVA